MHQGNEWPRVYDLRDRDERDPRDGLIRDLDLPRGDERELVVDRDRVYELDGEDSRTLAPSESADEKMVSQTFASWNQITEWLRQLDSPRIAAMTGSGACVFAEFATETAARSALTQVPPGMNGFVAQGLGRHPLHDFVEE